jgi:hypothetical protein
MEKIPKPKPAYVDDMDDETGRAVRGTRRSAAVPQQKPKVSQRDMQQRDPRAGKPRRSRMDDGGMSFEQQQQMELISSKEVRIERRKSNAASTKSPRKSDRPPTTHESRGYPPLSQIHTSHHRSENHTHYGLPTATPRTAPLVTQPLTIRPRAVTTQTAPSHPMSHFQAQGGGGGGGGYPNGPPLSMSAYYQPPPMAAPSFPPPSPSSSYMRFIQTPSQQVDYFSPQAVSRPLSSRFEPIARTQSAFGSHPPPSTFDPVPRTASAFGTRESPSQALVDYDGGYYEDDYPPSEAPSVRRPERRESIRVPSQRLTKEELDYRHMPPPPRPSILRRPTAEYRAPTEYTLDPAEPVSNHHHHHRRSRDYYDEPPVRTRRPSTHRHSVSYDLGDERVTVEAANSSRRRQSLYEHPSAHKAPSSNYEDKLNHAASYQEDVEGPTVPLTAETLKKQQRRQAGSRSSTKSSGSRDDSDYKKSATTRTTRSGSGNGNDDENVTIKVTGQARVMFGNTAIDCTDGGQIEISQNKNNFRDGRSERSTSEFGGPPRFDDRDRRSRVDRPSGRSRMGSQSGQSYARPSHHAYYQMENDHYS